MSDEDETTADMLIELATLDEVSARIPTSREHDADMVPPWCELVMVMRRDDGSWPVRFKAPLRRHDGELIIQVLHEVLHPTAGGAVADGLWLDLDAVMDRLMVNPRKRDAGLATGLTIALARIMNPFNPDEDAVKAIALERYEARHPSKDD
jgi:hypothetical protein